MKFLELFKSGKEKTCPVYLFRNERFSPSGDTVLCVAPLENVVAVFSGGGLMGEDGVSAVFGGAAVFKNEKSGQYFLGVWGARNAARFRSKLRNHMPITILKTAPDARLIFTTKKDKSQVTE